MIAHYCLLKLHWSPEEYLNKPRKERAFIAAAIELEIAREKEEVEKMKKA